MLTVPVIVRKNGQSGSIEMTVNALNVTHVEKPVNLGGIGGASMGRNPVRVHFAFGNIEMVDMSAYDAFNNLGFVQASSDTNDLLINPGLVNFVGQDPTDLESKDWFAHMPNGNRIRVSGPGILYVTRPDVNTDTGEDTPTPKESTSERTVKV